MLSYEFLPEAISLSKYKVPATDAVSDAMVDTLTGLYEDLRQFNHIASANEDEFSTLLKSELTGYFQIHLRRNLESKLTGIARKMVGSGNLDRKGSWVQVDFMDTGPDLGIAFSDNRIGLSEVKYLDSMIDELCERLYQGYIDNHEGDSNRLLAIKRLLKRSSDVKYMVSDIISYARIGRDYSRKLVPQLVGTFIHEVVHVAQHLPQQKKGLSDTEYRSYLTPNKSEFYKSFAKDSATNKYKNHDMMARLHAASPQEIGSYTHNLAMEIVDELGWDEYDDPKDIKHWSGEERVRHLLDKVRNHLVSRGITPTTRAEIDVFRRYVKMVYVEVEKYREMLLDKLKNKEEEED